MREIIPYLGLIWGTLLKEATHIDLIPKAWALGIGP